MIVTNLWRKRLYLIRPHGVPRPANGKGPYSSKGGGGGQVAALRLVVVVVGEPADTRKKRGSRCSHDNARTKHNHFHIAIIIFQIYHIYSKFLINVHHWHIFVLCVSEAGGTFERRGKGHQQWKETHSVTRTERSYETR